MDYVRILVEGETTKEGLTEAETGQGAFPDVDAIQAEEQVRIQQEEMKRGKSLNWICQGGGPV